MTTPNTSNTNTAKTAANNNAPTTTGLLAVGNVEATTSTKKTATTTGTTTTKKKKARPKKKKTSPQNQNQQQLTSPLAQMKSMMEYQNAQNELYQIQQRQHDVSMDPLWTNSSGSTAPKTTTTTTNSSSSSSSSSSNNNGSLTQDEEILQSCLQRVGLVREGSSAETKKDVIGHGAYEVILEYARKYALELLQDAQEYAQHCNGSASTNSKVTSRDLELASQFLQDEEEEHQGFSTDMNRIPLPLLPANCYTGIVLPDDNHTTTLARTYDVVSAARISQQFSLSSSSQPPKTNTNNQNPNNNDNNASTIKSSSATTPSYGATRKRQIPINFKKSNNTDDNQTTTTTTTVANTNTPTSPMTTSATTTNKRKADGLDLILS